MGNKMISMFLMNKKGYFILKNFIDTFGSEFISYIVTSEDKNIERDYYNDIIDLCRCHKISVYDRKERVNITSSYIFAIGWRWMIESGDRLIVFHDSILPRYRGFAPLVNSLINKEKEIGVTALFASSSYDRGDIISQKAIPVDYPIKIHEAIDKVSLLYFELVKEITDKIINGVDISAIPQDDNCASYSLWRDEEDYLIDWSKDSEYIQRFIDSTGFPYKGASTYVKGKKYRVLDSEIVQDVFIENRTPGKIIFIDGFYPVVVCGKGLLKLKSIKDDETKQELIPLKRFRVRFE